MIQILFNNHQMFSNITPNVLSQVQNEIDLFKDSILNSFDKYINLNSSNKEIKIVGNYCKILTNDILVKLLPNIKFNQQLAMKHLDSTIQEMKNFLESDSLPKSMKVSILSRLSLSYLQKQNIDEALHYANEGIEIYPEFTPSYITRASIYTQMGETEKALKDCDTMLSYDPAEIDAFNFKNQSTTNTTGITDVSEKLKSLLNDKWCDCLSKFDASNVSNDNLQKLYKLAFSKFKPSNMNDTHILGMYDCELNKVTQNVDNRTENLNNQVHNNNNMNTLLNQDSDNNRIRVFSDNKVEVILVTKEVKKINDKKSTIKFFPKSVKVFDFSPSIDTDRVKALLKFIKLFKKVKSNDDNNYFIVFAGSGKWFTTELLQKEKVGQPVLDDFLVIMKSLFKYNPRQFVDKADQSVAFIYDNNEKKCYKPKDSTIRMRLDFTWLPPNKLICEPYEAEIYDNNQSVNCQIINEFDNSKYGIGSIYNLKVDSERSLIYILDYPNKLKIFDISENALQPLNWNINFNNQNFMSLFTVNDELHFVIQTQDHYGSPCIYRYQRFAKSLGEVGCCENNMGGAYCATVGKNGKIYAPVKGHNNSSNIAIFDCNGKLYDYIPFSFNSISHIAIDDVNENLIIVDQNNRAILKVFSLKEAKVITTIEIRGLYDCCVDQRNGNIIVAVNGECIKIFSYLGEEIKIIKREPNQYFYSVAMDYEKGYLYVNDSNKKLLQIAL
ncbi:hypothetical protein ABK040_008536 [Willaertia magna]